MSNEWLRLWHDMPTDPKWRTIACVSGQRIGDVMSVYVFLLVSGSANATERGRTQSFNAEDVATALDLDTSDVEEIVTAMQGRVLTGDMLRGWVGRQPVREDGAAERAKAWREAQKEAKRTQPNADRTQPNAVERDRTLDKDLDLDTDKEKAEIEGAGVPPAPPPADPPSTAKRKSLTFDGWTKTLAEGELAIPEDHYVFDQAEKAGLPADFVELAWEWFKRKYSRNPKRYTDWRQVFANAVSGAWGNLWRAMPSGGYELTSQGIQFSRTLSAGGERAA